MIDIPAADIKEKIKAAKGLSDEEIEQKIKEKFQQLAGLITEDGAALIIANELGVELVKPAGGPAKIGDLYPGMRNVTVTGKLTRKYELREFDKNGRQGKVANLLLGDETGQVRVTLWNDQTDQFEKLNEGDTLRITNAWVKENRGYKELHLNTDSKLEQNPDGVTVTAPTAQREAARKMINELTGDEQDVELLGTLLQVYDPRFFTVCPECGKRLTEQEGKQVCAQHGAVTPQTNYVMNAILNDGTGNIRTTFWKEQAQRLTGKSDAEFLQYQENPQAFEEVKQELTGEIIKVVGRVKKNETFDRVEFTANLVFTDVDPSVELARLKGGVAVKEAAPAETGSEPAPTPQETPAEAPDSTTPAERDEPSGIESGVEQSLKEEVISLDDLDDLDEGL